MAWPSFFRSLLYLPEKGALLIQIYLAFFSSSNMNLIDFYVKGTLCCLTADALSISHLVAGSGEQGFVQLSSWWRFLGFGKV